MYKLKYPVIGTISNFILTILAYLPTFFLVDFDQNNNVCHMEYTSLQKFQLLFIGYGIVFNFLPIFLNVALNLYVVIKVR